MVAGRSPQVAARGFVNDVRSRLQRKSVWVGDRDINSCGFLDFVGNLKGEVFCKVQNWALGRKVA